jgi:LysM repeat protein
MVAKIVARVMAPIALAAVGVGIYLIVHSTIEHHTTTATQSSSATVANGAKHKPRKHRRVPKFYVDKSGDTLGRISARTHVPVSVLTTLNQSLESNPNSLQTGQRLRLRR